VLWADVADAVVASGTGAELVEVTFAVTIPRSESTVDMEIPRASAISVALWPSIFSWLIWAD
jgi:hypothetical protein